MAHGLEYDAFWRRTPAELNLILDGTVARLKREQRDRMSAAYMTARLTMIAFHNPKGFPDADTVLKERSRRVVGSLEEQRAVLRRFAGK